MAIIRRSSLQQKMNFAFIHWDVCDQIRGGCRDNPPITPGVLPPRPLPRPLDQHIVSLDLDLTVNDPRVRPNHTLSLILVAVIQPRRNFQLRLGEYT